MTWWSALMWQYDDVAVGMARSDDVSDDMNADVALM
jgi:hypothetical protein